MGLKLAVLNRVKRNKLLTILLLPIVVCMFAIGWIMYATGRQASERTPQKPAKQAEDHITIGALPLEEDQEITAY